MSNFKDFTIHQNAYLQASVGYKRDLGDLVPGVQECVRMVGAGGKMTAWIPSHEAYGAEGDPSKKIGPNTTLGYDIEVIDVVKYADWVNERRSWKD